MGVDKAFAFFFNDEDMPAFHACSGLTRHYQPKPSYHAVAWMLKNLADYRFSRALHKSERDGYLFEFTPEKPGAPVILAAWHATREAVAIDLGGASITRSELMPLAPGTAAVPLPQPGETTVIAGTLPVLLWVKDN